MRTNKYYKFVLELEDDGRVDVEIGHRGGFIKIPSTEVFSMFDIPDKYFDSVPSYIGAGCNYLGGGVRGSIFSTGGASEFESHGVPKTYAKILGKVGDALKQRYEELEGGMNDEEDTDGETNWDAMATNASRRAGVRSAY